MTVEGLEERIVGKAGHLVDGGESRGLLGVFVRLHELVRLLHEFVEVGGSIFEVTGNIRWEGSQQDATEKSITVRI